MKQPFFIVGLMRSGTTYLYRLMENHPRIGLTNEARVADFLAFCCKFANVPFLDQQELDFITPTSVRGIIQHRHCKLFSSIFLKHAEAALEEFYQQTFADKDFTHWGEKLPSPGTALAMQASYPNPKYIVLLRDPRDTWCSVLDYRKRVRVGPEFANHTPTAFGKSWGSTYTGYLTYLSHHLEVHYENLVNSPEQTLTAVLDFLGLSGAEDLVNGLNHEASFRHHGTSRSPSASIGRWRDTLDAKIVLEIEAGAGDMMKRCGYRLSSES